MWAKLPEKQRLFVDEYLKDFNGTQACIRAGYAKSGASTQAVRLLANDKIQACLSARKAEMRDKHEITQERVLQELASIAFGDMGDYISVDKEGVVTIKDTDALKQAGLTKNIKTITQTHQILNGDGKGDVVTNVNLKFILHDKLEALKMLAKRYGLDISVVKVEGDENRPLPVKIYIPDNGRYKPPPQE